MANIMVNEVCNLACPYCFADKYVNGDTTTDITYKNFKKCVDWINHSSDVAGDSGRRIALIGGEPTLHHQFLDLLNYAVLNRRPHQDIVVFTNGILAGDYAEYFSKNDISLLINLNSPEDIGENKYNKVLKSIDTLRKKGVSFTVGINLYRDMDFSFLTNVVKEYSFKSVRLGLICPNTPERKQEGTSSYFEKIRPVFVRLLEELAVLGCSANLDCQKMPFCYLKEDMDRIQEIQEKNDVVFEIFDHAKCIPVIDILTDLSLVRCFGVSDRKYAVPMEAFDTESDAEAFFTTQLDNLCSFLPAESKCIETACEYIYQGKCQGGCLAYKMDQYDSLKAALQCAITPGRVSVNLDE